MLESEFPYFFKEVKGFGQLKNYTFNPSSPEEINEVIQYILHPEYPSKKNDIAIILPTFNEGERFHNVIDFVAELKKVVSEVFLNTSIYFVNDGSKDNTADLIEELINKEELDSDTVTQQSMLDVHNLKLNTRKAGTYIEGIKTIDADILVFVDADNSFFIEDIILMINLINEGYYDMVIATKDATAEDRPPVRRFVSFAKRTLTKPFLPKGVYDSQTGLKVMSSLAARYILPHLHENNGLAIDLEMIHLAKKFNFRVLQLPVRCIDRDGSHVNIVKDSISFLKTLTKILTSTKNIVVNKNDYWN